MNDTPYITPPIRVLLRKRNKLLRPGKIDSAQSITIRIGKMIAGVRSKLLSKASTSDTKQLWQLLRSTRNWSRNAWPMEGWPGWVDLRGWLDQDKFSTVTLIWTAAPVTHPSTNRAQCRATWCHWRHYHCVKPSLSTIQIHIYFS